ncbi:MAG: DUF1731 domain-containing protein [Acidobacteriota bacterium]
MSAGRSHFLRPQPVEDTRYEQRIRPRRAIGMSLGLPAPAPLIRLGARLVLRTDPELVLLGRYCVSRRLREEGFEFAYPDLPGALRHLLASPG